MKKRIAVLLCVCMLIAALCACGAKTKTPDETPDAAQNETVNPENENTEPTEGTTDGSEFIGNWHDKVNGRGIMEATAGDNGYIHFEVKWADSADKTNVWSFNGIANEAGVLEYDDGFKGVVEYDKDGKETKTIISEEAVGTVELLEDGTLVWTEKGEEETVHEFVKD